MERRKRGSDKEVPVKLLVLDVLKPHKPNILDLGKIIYAADSVENVNLSVYAVDEKTESVKVVIEGSSLDFETLKALIEESGAVVHSMDKVILGSRIVIDDRILPAERTI